MTSLGRAVTVLSEVARKIKFSTIGREARHDPTGIVVSKLMSAVPEFEKSRQETTPRKGGMNLRGAWPTSGKHVFDWEVEAWSERAGDVIVKINMWSADGTRDGISYRANVATIDKLLPKIVQWIYKVKSSMKGGRDE